MYNKGQVFQSNSVFIYSKYLDDSYRNPYKRIQLCRTLHLIERYSNDH